MAFTTNQKNALTKMGRSAIAVAAAATLLLTACSSPGASDGANDAGADDSMQPITFAVGAANALFAAPYLAQSLGYFEEEGLDVTLLESTGANTANFMAIGDADIAYWSLGVPLLLSTQGKQTTQLTNSTGVSLSSDLAGAVGVETLDDLRGGRIATVAMGTTVYGAAKYYNEKFDLGAEIVVYQDNPSVVAALASGQVDGATMPHVELAPLFEEGRAVSLINSTDPEQVKEVWGIDYVIGGLWALEETVPEKRKEFVRLISAYQRAIAWMKEESPETVATELLKNEAFQALTVEQLAGYVSVVAPLLNPDDGVITEESWNFALEQVANWDLDGFDQHNPAVSFDAMVDMSLLEEAQG